MGRQEDVSRVCYEASLKVGGGLRVLVIPRYTHVDGVRLEIHGAYKMDRRNYKVIVISRDMIVSRVW